MTLLYSRKKGLFAPIFSENLFYSGQRSASKVGAYITYPATAGCTSVA